MLRQVLRLDVHPRGHRDAVRVREHVSLFRRGHRRTLSIAAEGTNEARVSDERRRADAKLGLRGGGDDARDLAARRRACSWMISTG